MSRAFKIIGEQMKEKGLEGGEVLVMKIFEALEVSMPLIVADEDASQAEKLVAGVLVPILPGFKPAVQKATDFDKDGQVG